MKETQLGRSLEVVSWDAACLRPSHLSGSALGPVSLHPAGVWWEELFPVSFLGLSGVSPTSSRWILLPGGMKLLLSQR